MDAPSADGKWHLTRVYDVLKGVVDAQGYQSVTMNDRRNTKDEVYGYSAFSVYASQYPRHLPQLLWLFAEPARRPHKSRGLLSSNSTRIRNQRRIWYLSPSAGIGPVDILATVEATPASAQYLPPRSSHITLPVGYNLQVNPAISLVFSQPSLNAYQNFSPVWFNPKVSDAKQSVEQQSGILAQTNPQINWLRW
jgi:cellobiose dehydrogenase (acceptor)